MLEQLKVMDSASPSMKWGGEDALLAEQCCHLVVFARGLDSSGVSAQFVGCLEQHAEFVTVVDIGQLLIDRMCCLYFLLDIRAGLSVDIIKSFLLTGKLTSYEVDYKITSYEPSDEPTAQGEAPSALPYGALAAPGGIGSSELVVAQLVQNMPFLSSRLLSPFLGIVHAYGGRVYSVHQESIPPSGGSGAQQNLVIKALFPSPCLPDSVRVIWDAPMMKKLYEQLQQLCWANHAELVLRRDDLKYKPKNKTLVVMGMCETVIQQELIDEMLKFAGTDPATFDKCAPTPQQIVQRKLLSLRGQPATLEAEVLTKVMFTEGAHFVCKALKTMGYKLALMTQGFDLCAQHVGKQLGFDYVLSNHLEVIDGRLTGGVTGEVVGLDTTHMMDQLRKVDWLQLLRDKENIHRTDVIVVGDYQHAQFLYESCGARIHFNAHKHKDLTSVLYMMGFKHQDVKQFRQLLKDKLPRPNQQLPVVASSGMAMHMFVDAASFNSSVVSSNNSPQSSSPSLPSPSPPLASQLPPPATRLLRAVVYIYGEASREALWRVTQALSRYEGVEVQHLQQANIHKSLFLGMTVTWPAFTCSSRLSHPVGGDEQWRLLRTNECLETPGDHRSLTPPVLASSRDKLHRAEEEEADQPHSSSSEQALLQDSGSFLYSQQEEGVAVDNRVLKELVFVATVLSLKIQFALYANWNSVDTGSSAVRTSSSQEHLSPCDDTTTHRLLLNDSSNKRGSSNASSSIGGGDASSSSSGSSSCSGSSSSASSSSVKMDVTRHCLAYGGPRRRLLTGLEDGGENGGEESDDAHYIVVIVQHPGISCTLLHATYKLLAQSDINLEAIERMSEGSVLRVLQLRMRVPSTVDAVELKSSLLSLSAEFGADVAMQQDNIMRYCRRLVVFDMDSTLIQQEVIDELARCAGVLDEVSHITQQAMSGHLDFYESLIARVKLLKGLDGAKLDEVQNALELTPGARRLCHALRLLGYRLAVVSGGFTRFARFVKRELGLHHSFANSLEMDENGVLTGRVAGPVVTPQRKVSLMRMLADIDNCSVDQVIAVGDGANDIPMLLQAGMGVAFCAKPRVQEHADFRLNTRDLSNLLFLLGIPEQVVRKLESSKAPTEDT
eukprot:GHVS01029164.1.p1 GENE.GHVS01029164.1~~GHVS01029164.1.p1  ORF type:complete len:1116 (-),score=248.63 GHVS01029164.1:198-3545(-)